MKKILKSITKLNDDFVFWMCFYSFLLGGAIVYSFYCDIKYEFFIKCYSKEMLTALVTASAAIYAILIPISIDIVSKNLKEYKEDKVADFFTSEEEFQVQLYAHPLLILSSLPLISIDKGIGFLSLALYVLYLITFIKFISYIRLVIKYAINTDEVVYKKTQEELDGQVG